MDTAKFKQRPGHEVGTHKNGLRFWSRGPEGGKDSVSGDWKMVYPEDEPVLLVQRAGDFGCLVTEPGGWWAWVSRDRIVIDVAGDVAVG